MGALALASTAIGLIGGAVQARGSLAAGRAAQQASYFKAKQEEQAGNEARAVGQRQMLERRRMTDLALSNIQAGAAAGGGSATSGDILNLSGNVAKRGEYQALMEMYTGENKARGYETAAMASRMTGDAELTGSRYRALGTLLSSGTSAFDRLDRGRRNGLFG